MTTTNSDMLLFTQRVTVAAKNVQGLLWNFCILSHIIYYQLVISLMAIPENHSIMSVKMES